MKILFDQGTPVAIRNALQGHFVRTANEQGWSALLNGELLRVAEEAGFARPGPYGLSGLMFSTARMSQPVAATDSAFNMVKSPLNEPFTE